MIYKCKNCGLEYNENPEYCDCGNNVFVCIEQDFDLQNQSEYEDFAPSEEEYNECYDDYEDEVPVDDYAPEDYCEPQYDSNQNNFDYEDEYEVEDEEDDDEKDKKKSEKTAFIIAVSVFSISVILALFLITKAILYPVKSPAKSEKVKTEQVAQIPSVDSYWVSGNNNAKHNTNSVALYDDNSNSPKQEVKIVKQDKIPVITSIVSPKKVEKVKQDNSQKPITKPIEKKTTASTSKNMQKKNDKEKVVSKPQKQEVAKKNTNGVKELSDYKVGLRQRLFSTFPILTVSGVGTASVGFTISSDGKLQNRHFIKQSDNKSLNDAMYHMLMRTPSYNPPPASYSGEMIILKMDYNNGHYSFSYQ